MGHFMDHVIQFCLNTIKIIDCLLAKECPPLYAPDHGTVQGTRYTYDEQLYFVCNRGYKLEGSNVRQCQDDKTWSGEEVTCRGLYLRQL